MNVHDEFAFLLLAFHTKEGFVVPSFLGGLHKGVSRRNEKVQ